VTSDPKKLELIKDFLVDELKKDRNQLQNIKTYYLCENYVNNFERYLSEHSLTDKFQWEEGPNNYIERAPVFNKPSLREKTKPKNFQRISAEQEIRLNGLRIAENSYNSSAKRKRKSSANNEELDETITKRGRTEGAGDIVMNDVMEEIKELESKRDQVLQRIQALIS